MSALEAALRAYQDRDLRAAEVFVRRALESTADDPAALNLLGIVLAQTGRIDAALGPLERAAAIDAADPSVHANLSQVLAQAGRTEPALRACERALALGGTTPPTRLLHARLLLATGRAAAAEAALTGLRAEFPPLAEVHYLLGNALRQRGDPAAALACYDVALRLGPEPAELANARGIALHATGQLAAAAAAFERAIATRPSFAEAHGNLGNASRELGRHGAALAAFDAALALAPTSAELHNNRGLVLRELDRPTDALACFDAALALRADYPEAHNNQALALHELGRSAEALASLERALHLRPAYADALGNRALVQQALGLLHAALDSCRAALAVAPSSAAAHYNLGNVLSELGRRDAAILAYDAALRLAPDHAQAHYNRANALRDLRRREDAARGYERAYQLQPALAWLAGTRLYTRMQLCDWADEEERVGQLLAAVERGERAAPPFAVLARSDSPRLQHVAARTWAGAQGAATSAPAEVRRPQPGERIRIGYFSADFHEHATAHLIAGLVETHDRARFDVTAFSFGPSTNDAMQGRLRAGFESFLDVRGLSDAALARVARERGIDIAVDLKGFTQEARPGVFAARAAPLQVSYLGYPGTMGADFIDYLVADRVLIPPRSRAHYTERIAFLPHSYQANDRTRPIAARTPARAELGLPARGIVFCCFNNPYKITPRTFAGWMRVLERVPGAVLWLIDDEPATTANLRAAAARSGTDPARLVFAPRLPLAEHLARHRAADLFLDTHPYNAHTTASDALWTGLPLLTRIGESFAARVAASLLSALGLDELIVGTDAEYESTAVRLAHDHELLGELRRRLDSARLVAPLFDTQRFTRHLEDAYAAMHARRLEGLPPADFAVESRAARAD